MRAGDTRRPFWDSSTSIGPSARPSGSPSGPLVPGLERRADVDDQAHPAAAMIDDHDSIVVAKRARKTHGARGGSAERRPARGGEVSGRASGRRCR